MMSAKYAVYAVICDSKKALLVEVWEGELPNMIFPFGSKCLAPTGVLCNATNEYPMKNPGLA